jgi:hypothetical protein
MAKQKLDAETQKLLAEGQKRVDFVKSEEWAYAKAKLYASMGTLNSIVSLPVGVDESTLAREVLTRFGAIDLVMKWIQNIEGEAAQAQNTLDELQKQTDDTIVTYYQ